MDVAQGSINIAGQMTLLARRYRAEGHRTSTVDYHPSYMGHPADVVVATASTPNAASVTAGIAREAFRAHDVFGFWFGTTLTLDGRDLPYYAPAGKRVVMHHVGSDVRTPDNARIISPHGVAKPVNVDAQQQHLDHLAEHIDVAISHSPANLAMLGPERYRTTYMVPIPIDLDALPLREPPQNPRPLVVHAPTSRAFKGTDAIVAAVRRLKDDGLDFDFELVEGKSHAAALERYRQADLVVDQIRAGGYGTLSLECGAMGVPCVTHEIGRAHV